MNLDRPLEPLATQSLQPGGPRDGEFHGRTRTIILATAFRSWRGRMARRWLFAKFNVVDRFDALRRFRDRFPFKTLGVIHFLRWVIITDWPYLGGSQPREYLDRKYLLFCANYNGDPHEYLDIFADSDPGSLESIWGDTPNFKPPRPVTPWKDLIFRHKVDSQLYYSAYPQASAPDVRAARRVRALLDAFDRRRGSPGSAGEEGFRSELVDLVRSCQGHLGVIERNPAVELNMSKRPPDKTLQPSAEERLERTMARRSIDGGM